MNQVSKNQVLFCLRLRSKVKYQIPNSCAIWFLAGSSLLFPLDALFHSFFPLYFLSSVIPLLFPRFLLPPAMSQLLPTCSCIMQQRVLFSSDWVLKWRPRCSEGLVGGRQALISRNEVYVMRMLVRTVRKLVIRMRAQTRLEQQECRS